jgi:sulfur carrier protein
MSEARASSSLEVQNVTTILFNGKDCEVPHGCTIEELLKRAEIRTRLVAVEVNLEIVPFEQFAQYIVKEGDSVEVVTLVGGG